MLKNIFSTQDINSENEFIEDLLKTDNFKVERIISEGHVTEKNFWYDQETNEFVLLIKGEAKIKYENEEIVLLAPGDWLIIPAHKKHRVEWTSETEKTFWLTIHY